MVKYVQLWILKPRKMVTKKNGELLDEEDTQYKFQATLPPVW